MSGYHPSVRLAHYQWTIAENPDHSLTVSVAAVARGDFGGGPEHRVGHDVRVPTTHPAYGALAGVLAEACVDHYVALGLEPPAPDHLPAFLAAHADPDALRAAPAAAPAPPLPQIEIAPPRRPRRVVVPAPEGV